MEENQQPSYQPPDNQQPDYSQKSQPQPLPSNPPLANAPQPAPPVAPVLGQPPQPVVNPTQIANPASRRSKTFNALHQHESPIAVLITVVAILLICFNVLFSIRVQHIRHIDYTKYVKQQANIYNNLPSTIAAKDQKSFGPFTENRPTGTLDLSHLVNSTYTAENQNINAGLNEQVNLADGQSLMVTSIQPNWQSVDPDSITKPATGDYFILLNLVIGNRSKQVQYIGDASGMSGELNGKQLLNIDVPPFGQDFTNTSTNTCDNIDYNQFEPGQQQSCVSVVQVPDGSKPSIVFSSAITTDSNLNPIQMKATINIW